jgi:transposase
MSQKSSAPAAREPTAAKPPAERVVRDIRRRTRKQHSAEEKIRVVLEGLRGEESIAALCRREGIAESLYYAWSKEFLEAGKRRWPATRPARDHRRGEGAAPGGPHPEGGRGRAGPRAAPAEKKLDRGWGRPR